MIKLHYPLFEGEPDNLGGGGTAPVSPAVPTGEGLDVGALLGFGQSTGPIQISAETKVEDKHVPVAQPSTLEEMILANDATSKAKIEQAPPEEKKPENQSQEAGFDFQKWFAEKYPENPDPSKVAKAEDWKSARSIAAKAFEDLKSLSQRNAELKTRLANQGKPAPESAKAAVMPESDAVKTLQLELEQLRQSQSAKLQEYEQFKATQDLASNPAFRQEFDGKRAALLEEMNGIAEEASVEKSIVEQALNAKTPFQLAKALNDIEDPTAKRLIEERAKSFMELSNKREAALKGNPLEELKKWNDYAESLNGNIGISYNQALQGQLVSSVPEVIQELTGESGDMFFRTDGGRFIMQSLAQRFEGGDIPTAKEAVQAMALAQAAPFYRNMTKQLFQERLELQKALAEKDTQLSKYASLEPNGGGAGLPTSSSSGFDVGAMWSGIGR